jgi:asparagine synthase (glutamine-hydrolysing)
MCGICGIVARKRNVNFQEVKQLNDAIAHRGPDDEGFVSYNSASRNIVETKRNTLQQADNLRSEFNIHLGHRRLSIIDVSEGGHQPFRDDTGKYFLVFNGEIYNYIELRSALEQRGVIFRSGTDTEVLLNLYIEYGEECLSMLNGMWSFVILDVDKNELFGSRDRFGVKPFYYFLDKDHFIFSSEIKSLLRSPHVKTGINDPAAFDYLAGGRLTDPVSTMFSNIVELDTSSYFRLDLNSFSFVKKPYYELKFNNKWESFNADKAVSYTENVREKIINAVSLRLRSDVQVGSCLSGGIDSSSIVCVINMLLKDHKLSQIGDLQKTFTASYPGTVIDESKWAALVTESVMTDSIKTYPKPEEFADDLEKLVYVQDVPFGSTTIYSQYRVMKLASENGIKVLLDGQGADELFTGYTYFIRPFYNEMIKNGDIRSLINEIRYVGNSPLNAKELVNTLNISIAKLFLPPQIKRKLYNLKVRQNYLLNKDFYSKYESRIDLGRVLEYTGLNIALYDQFTRTSLKELLKYEDRNSMNFSIEARTPFADDIDLIEYVFQMPSSYKIRDGWTKYILREAMTGIIPEKIRRRTDKLGFATPEYFWLNSMKDEIKDYFTPDLNEYFDTSKILQNWDSIITGESQTGFTDIWRFINFAVWKKVFQLKDA